MQLIREDFALSRLDTYANAIFLVPQIVRTTLSSIFSPKLIHLSSIAASFSHCRYTKTDDGQSCSDPALQEG